MKNKLLSIILALFMIIPCAFALTACGETSKEEWEKDAISESFWKSSISTNTFYVENGEATKGSNENTYILHYINGYYYVRGSNYENKFKKVVEDSITTYQKVTEGMNGYEGQTITETAYNENLSNYYSLLDYIKNNQAKFTFYEDNGSGRYKLNISGSEIETLAKSIRTQTGLTAFNMDYIVVGIYAYDGFAISFWNNDGQHVLVLKFPNSTFSYYLYDMVQSMGSYTIKGGPSATDVNYVEIKVTEEGFYRVSPNQDQNVAGRAICGKYISSGDNAGKYQVWSSNGTAWTTDVVTADYYIDTFYKPLVSCFTGNIFTTGEYMINYLGDLYRTMPCSQSVNRYVYNYSNVMIDINQNNQIVKATWNLQIHDNAQNLDSAVYSMTLIVEDVTIEYPQV